MLGDAALFVTYATASAPLGWVRSQPSVGRAETPAPAEPLVTRLIILLQPCVQTAAFYEASAPPGKQRPRKSNVHIV